MRSEFTKAIKLAEWEAAGGHCRKCNAKLYTGKFEFHHDLESTFSHDSSANNICVLCINCHSEITKARAPVIAKSNRQRVKHLGLQKRSSFQTNRSGKFKKLMSGKVERR